MIFPAFQNLAEFGIERVLNSLPEGIAIALFSGALLRILPKQNSRSRFAVWFIALTVVASLPWFPALFQNHFSSAGAGVLAGSSAISIPAQWATVLFVAWILTVFLLTVRLAIGLWRLYQLRKTCKPVDLASLDPSLASFVAELSSRKSPLVRPVTLATSDQLRVPAAIGLWKPMIVLPAWALRELPASELSIILRHEFAHLRHWDDWTNLLQKLVRVFFFFHPAVWWIEKRLSIEREMACDDVVVAETGNPTGYASCLVSLLERSLAQRGWTMAQALVHRAREASMRLARILETDRPIATHMSKPALGLAGVLTALCLVMAPNAPRLVSFEQSAQPGAGQYSAVLAQSAAIVPTWVHNADFRSSSSPAVSIPASAKTGTRSPNLLSKNFKTNPKDAAEIVAASQSASCHTLVQPEPAVDALAERSFVAAVSNVLFDESLFANQATRPDSPTVLVMRATQFVESSAGQPETIVWRVQVWRVTIVDATWKHEATIPAAHST